MTAALALAVTVIIRSYDYAQVPPDELAAARAAADRIFQSAGISLQWIDCRVPEDRRWSIGAECLEPLREGQEFVLRLLESAGGESKRAIAMGNSLFDRSTGTGVLITVDPRSISAIARNAATDPATLLGRATAHELGHRLLGHPKHSRSGLMRALWSRDELRRIRPAGWNFSAAEAAQMRQRLQTRLRPLSLVPNPFSVSSPYPLVRPVLYTCHRIHLRIGRMYGMNPKVVLAAAVAAVALVSSAPASAQTNRIGGVVRDETGGTIRGVIVRATVGGTSANAPSALTTATDDRGRFIFVVTRSGDWQLTFEAPGFDVMTIGVSVRLTGASPNLDVKLERHESPEAFGALAGIDSKTLSSQLASAAALLDEGRFDQAISAYTSIKASAPALTLVNLPLGNAYLGKKSYGESEAMFQEILKVDGESANALFAMGTVREAQGNAVDAQTWYHKASTADGRWTRPLMKLASLARAAGDRVSALRYLTRVIDLDPASADAVQALSMQKQLQLQ